MPKDEYVIENWLLAELQLMREEGKDQSELEIYNTLYWVYQKISTGKYKERMKVMEIDRLLEQGKNYMKTGNISAFLH